MSVLSPHVISVIFLLYGSFNNIVCIAKKNLYFIIILLFLMIFISLTRVGRAKDQGKVGETTVSKYSLSLSCIWEIFVF